jgi:alpha-tubulin suppressor-like RCC1 family protein
VDSLHNVRQISGRGSPTCALEENGRVWCWGSGDLGQLGDGEINHEVCEYDRDCSRTPVRVIDIDDAVYISADNSHACAVRTDGTVWCWGTGGDRLGDGKQVHQLCANGSDCSPFPVQVVGLNDTVQVSTSGPHTCALGRKGRVWCWGSNRAGQLGDGTTENSNVPVRVKDLGQAVQISAGRDFSCALTTDGKRWCWGSNGVCKLGTDCDWNGIEQSSVPVKVELP